MIIKDIRTMKDLTQLLTPAFARQQKDTHIVKPLLVLQVPNTPSPKDIGEWLDTIFNHWPGLTDEAIRHVLGDHSTQNFGRYLVHHISPERVQESQEVRVLIAKDAI